jgi:hypothetical protein
MPHLSREIILWTIRHILAHGDTDVFPYPIEFQFLADRSEEIADALAREDIAVYRPLSPLESLLPKSRFGFRTVHQLFFSDTVMFNAAVVAIGAEIEAARIGAGNDIGFSYRFEKRDDFRMFQADCRYADWLQQQHIRLMFADEATYTHVVEADISDFFLRIYHHRLENNLAEIAADRHVVSFVTSFIRNIRARQSFGIPVGSNASRVIAELSLLDIDRALAAQGYDATRYVDDFRIFVKPGQDPYAALAFLAEYLYSNDGLSLNASKTRILTLQSFRDELATMSGEDQEAADASAAEKLYIAIYESEDGAESIEQLTNLNLVGEITAEVANEYWDVGRIRILLRCMRLTKDAASVAFIRENIVNLLPFVKEVVLLMEELHKAEGVSFQDMEEAVVDLITSPASSHLPATRAWLLELFVRGVLTLSHEQARRLHGLREASDQRALLQIRSQLNEVHYFRRGKTHMDELTPWLQPAFILAAACLPEDEYEVWLNNIRRQLRFPLAELFCEWALRRRRAMQRVSAPVQA